MGQRPSLVDRFLARLKNNPVVAVLILLGLGVISLASFTDALTKLLSALPEIRHTVVTGEWQSEVLKDRRTDLAYTYSFSFKSDGGLLYGTVRRAVPYCEEHKNYGVCGGHGRTIAILDGRLDRKVVSFRCDWGELPGASPLTWVNVQETFRGVVAGNKIRFVQQDNQNSPPVEFLATQRSKPEKGGDS